MSERILLKDFLLKYSAFGGRLFRNNVGQAWAGKSQHFHNSSTVRVNNGDVVLRKARPLHAGLCKGSSDLIGWTPITITKSMVGEKIAVFTAVELKTGKVRVTAEQTAFIAKVNKDGGIATVARKIQDLFDALTKFKGRFK